MRATHVGDSGSKSRANTQLDDMPGSPCGSRIGVGRSPHSLCSSTGAVVVSVVVSLSDSVGGVSIPDPVLTAAGDSRTSQLNQIAIPARRCRLSPPLVVVIWFIAPAALGHQLRPVVAFEAWRSGPESLVAKGVLLFPPSLPSLQAEPQESHALFLFFLICS